jgi:thymidylate synthase (FAD)
MTEWWWSGSLDAFADMCKLRLKDDTQYESRLVAQMIDKEMATMFPVSWAALMTDWSAVIIEELSDKKGDKT